MPSFDDDLSVGGKIFTGGGAVTLNGPDGGAWFHIDNNPGPGRRLRISHGVNPGDNEIISFLLDGRIGIGTPYPSRALHVEGGTSSEIHSGGATGGFSFADREEGTFVESPQGGERWIWYASGRRARLWSGDDKLVVADNGNIGIGTPHPGDRLHVRGDIRTEGRLQVFGDIVTV